MLRRLGIRAKVLAVLAVPVLVLLAIASYVTVGSIQDARTARTVSDLVAVLPVTARAAETLQQERTLSVQEAGDKPLGGNLSAARSSTDEAITALGVAVRAVDLSALDPRVQQAVEDANYQHSRLPEFRDRVDAGTIPQSLVDSNYTDIVTADNNVTSVVAETLSERSLASQMSAYAAIAETIEQVLKAGPVAEDVLADDGADSGRVRGLAAPFAVQDQARSDARALTNNLRLGSIQLPSRNADLTAMQLSLTSGNTLTVSALDPTRWNSLTNAELAALRPVATDLLESASDRADTLATQAQEQAYLTIGLTAAAVALSIIIAFLVSRGIVVPMRRLTDAAGRVREELPRLVEQVAVPGESPDLSLANIPVASQDEVGRLAQAFNDVNSTTIQVAREQAALRGSIAEMFVNVARRDQVLLGRQLAFIDSLERTEEDPETLANLFRLDHLATRMRRNAESLLVLAGIDSGRRLREAMPLSDVVRTASSEIEQYDRVQLDLQADPLMHGFNALGAAHMLAELLENATLFSEPGTPVLVHTYVEDEKVVVRIVDQGLGMSDEELEAANRVISSTSPTEALGAQRLGLFVVARLSQRLGAHVFVKRARGDMSGTAAVISFPLGLFTANDPSLLGGGQTAAQRSAVLPTDESAGHVAPEAPVAVPVDLAALTDGATQQGLPRRRTGPETPAPAEPRSSVPTEQDVVLPAPTEARLSPEIAAEASGWTPLVAPTEGAPAALPARGSLPSRTPAPAAQPDPADEAPARPSGPRGGLFSGFRGRTPDETHGVDAAPEEPAATTGGSDAPSSDAASGPTALDAVAEQSPVEDAAPELPSLPRRSSAFDTAGVPASIADHEPEVSAADAARLDALSAPLTGSLPIVTPATAAEPEPEVEHLAPRAATDEPAEPEVAAAEVPALETVDETGPAADSSPFVVPGLVPDEQPAEAGTWSATPSWSEPQASVEQEAPSWAQPAAQAEPAWTEQPVDEPVAAEPVPAEPDPAWGRPAAQAAPAWSAPVEAAPAPVAPQAPVAPTWSAEPQAQPFPAPTAQQPAVPAPAVTPVQPDVAERPAPPLPDFASLLHGDEPAEPARPARRSFFSFRRKGADKVASPAPAAPAPAAPQGAAAWPSTSGAPAPQAPAAPPAAPAPQPVAAAAAPVAPSGARGWLPAASAALEAAQADTSTSTWGGGQWAPTPPPEPAAAGGWGTPTPQVPSVGWSAPVSAPAPVDVPEQPAAWGAPAEPAQQPAASSALPTRTRGTVPPPAPEPGADAEVGGDRRPHRDMSAWASSWSPDGAPVPQPTRAPSWSAQAAPGAAEQAAAPAPAAPAPAVDTDAAAMFALRANIQEQALSELSQLSSYRPQVDSPSAGGSLTRRVPTAIPAAPEITRPDEGDAPARDADSLRSRLSSFQSGSRRGRRALEDTEQGQAGAVPDQQPRTETDSQPVPPSPSW